MDAPEVHTPHGGHTGHRWLDIVLGMSALLISCISLYVAVHHGQTMEKLVSANSWPNLEFSSELTLGDAAFGPDSIKLRLTLENTGIGPARLESLELWHGDTPVADADQLAKLVRAAGDGSPFNGSLDGGTAVGRVIGAKSALMITGVTTRDGAAWRRPLLEVGSGLKSRICYCSVFGECFVVDDRKARTRPERIPQCLAPSVPYQDDIAGVVLRKMSSPGQAASTSPSAP